MFSKKQILSVVTAAVVAAAFPLSASAGQMGHKAGLTPQPKLDAKVAKALDQCAKVAKSCANVTNTADAVLVFPDVLTVDLGVGGSGGAGAMVQNGKIVGYYDIGKASAGFEAGAKSSSQVYAIEDPATVKKVENGGQWEIGTAANLTVITASATASARTGNPLVYVFDGSGLNAGLDVSVLKVWPQKAA